MFGLACLPIVLMFCMQILEAKPDDLSYTDEYW